MNSVYFVLFSTLVVANPNLNFKLETGGSNSVTSQMITPLNVVNKSKNNVLLKPLPSTSNLPEILSNPNYPSPSMGSALPDHLTKNAQIVTDEIPTIRSLNDPKVSEIPEVKAVDRLTVLWGQYMKVLSKDNPTYQTYMNWALELGPTKMGCLERYMSCTTWCELQGRLNSFPNCDTNQNGKQFIPGDPSECSRPLNELPTDPALPWPGGSGC